ncbi:sugar phosphate isomerase/epimerase family protein [Paraburkholderia bannensis]|uniref:sugar phosphate isomerase/epimerase family protein n=1 Tax=Paraburkholderia bannensis TaxID=765414 RepID=UPI002AC33A3E|nr:sugar phosphate isomerase/epimerase family protein [Paraburkholderia bannensis]
MPIDNNRIVFNTTAARHATLVMELDVARNAGYTAVEITQNKARGYLDAGYSMDELKRELDGLTVHGIGALIDVERQGSAEKELFKEADKLFMIAYAIGARGVQIVSGPLNVQAVLDYNDRGYSKHYTGLLHHRHEDRVRLTAKNLAAIADRAREYGLTVYLEALSWAPLNTLQQQVEVVRRVGRDNLKLVIDFWHCYTSGATPEQLSRVEGEHIYGVHVCDSLPYQGGVPIETVLRDVPTGSGVLNLREWVDAVKATGFNGWWCSETFCRKQQQGNSYSVAKAMKGQLESLVFG